jgi:hypothetical protein
MRRGQQGVPSRCAILRWPSVFSARTSASDATMAMGGGAGGGA